MTSPGGLGLDEHGVERPAHAGERVGARHHRRVHAHDDALLVVGELGDGEQLDDEAHLAGRGDVLRRHRRDALAVHVVDGARACGTRGRRGSRPWPRRRSPRRRRWGRPRRSRAPAPRRARRRSRRPSSSILVRMKLVVPLTMPSTRRTLSPARRLAQRAQQRDRAGDGGLVVEVDAVLLGGRVQRGAVLGEQRLVGGDDRRSRPPSRRGSAMRAGSMPPITSTTTSAPDDASASRSSVSERGVDAVARLRAASRTPTPDEARAARRRGR